MVKMGDGDEDEVDGSDKQPEGEEEGEEEDEEEGEDTVRYISSILVSTLVAVLLLTRRMISTSLTATQAFYLIRTR